MPVQKLKEFLDGLGIKYISIRHSMAYTAPEVAASAHIPGKELAKTVMVKVDGKMAMAVLRATDSIDFDLLKMLAGVTRVELAGEREFQNLFPDCDIGAMPPFGNLYGMAVFVDEKLSLDQEIAFNACSHAELIKLAYKDFERLVTPRVGIFSLESEACS